MIDTIFQSVEHTFYIQTFEELNSLALSKQEAWIKWVNLIKWNKQNLLIEYNRLQKLWIKLIKKYKYKFTDWEVLEIKTNFHEFLIDTSGNGLQHLLRFYHDRHLDQWKNHIFEFGLLKLINQYQYTHLEMFFLTHVICEDWASNYTDFEAFHAYYQAPKYNKTKALYQTFIDYQQKKESADLLYEYLASYNPQYNLAAKNTPLFFKKLYIEIQSEHAANNQLKSR